MDDHGGDEPEGRTTAPQSEYTLRDAGTGAIVALVGLLITVGIPLLFH